MGTGWHIVAHKSEDIRINRTQWGAIRLFEHNLVGSWPWTLAAWPHFAEVVRNTDNTLKLVRNRPTLLEDVFRDLGSLNQWHSKPNQSVAQLYRKYLCAKFGRNPSTGSGVTEFIRFFCHQWLTLNFLTNDLLNDITAICTCQCLIVTRPSFIKICLSPFIQVNGKSQGMTHGRTDGRPNKPKTSYLHRYLSVAEVCRLLSKLGLRIRGQDQDPSFYAIKPFQTKFQPICSLLFIYRPS